MQVPIVAISAAHDYKMMNWSQEPIMWSWHLSLPLLLHDVFFFLILYEQTITDHYRNLQFIAIKSNCLISYRAGAWYYLIFPDFLNSGFKMASKTDSKTKSTVCS